MPEYEIDDITDEELQEMRGMLIGGMPQEKPSPIGTQGLLPANTLDPLAEARDLFGQSIEQRMSTAQPPAGMDILPGGRMAPEAYKRMELKAPERDLPEFTQGPVPGRMFDPEVLDMGPHMESQAQEMSPLLPESITKTSFYDALVAGGDPTFPAEAPSSYGAVLRNYLKAPFNAPSDIYSLAISTPLELARMKPDELITLSHTLFAGGTHEVLNKQLMGDPQDTPEANLFRIGMSAITDEYTDKFSQTFSNKPITALLEMASIALSKVTGGALAAVPVLTSSKRLRAILDAVRKSKTGALNVKKLETREMHLKNLQKYSSEWAAEVSKIARRRMGNDAEKFLKQLVEDRALAREKPGPVWAGWPRHQAAAELIRPKATGKLQAEDRPGVGTGAWSMEIWDEASKKKTIEIFHGPMEGDIPIAHGLLEDGLSLARRVYGPGASGEEMFKAVDLMYALENKKVPVAVQRMLTYKERGEKHTGMARFQGIAKRALESLGDEDLKWYQEFKRRVRQDVPERFIPEAATIFSILSPKKPVEMNLAEMYWVMKHYRDFMFVKKNQYDKAEFKRYLLDIRTSDRVEGYHRTDIPRGEKRWFQTTNPTEEMREKYNYEKMVIPFEEFVTLREGAPRKRIYERSPYPLRVERDMPIKGGQPGEVERVTQKDTGMMFAQDQAEKIAEFYDTAAMSGDLKTKAFTLTLLHDDGSFWAPGTVNDVQVAKHWGLEKKGLSDIEFRTIQHMITQSAVDLGINPQEAQAILWAISKSDDPEANLRILANLGPDWEKMHGKIGTFPSAFTAASRVSPEFKQSHNRWISEYGDEKLLLPGIEDHVVKSKPGEYPMTDIYFRSSETGIGPVPGESSKTIAQRLLSGR